MTKSQKSINEIIHDQLAGNLSFEDKERLQAWIGSSEVNKARYEQFIHEIHWVGRYNQYVEIDERLAWEKFQKKHLPVRSFLWRKIACCAAALLLPLIGLCIYYFRLNQEKTESVLAQEAHVAMLKSEQSGKKKATLILTNGRKIKLQPTSDVTLLNSSSVLKQSIDTQQVSKQVMINNRLITPRNSEYWITFEDGTTVHLNYNTTLMYPTHFSSVSRTVYLEGEAYFQVAEDSQRPFRVVTTNGVIKEYGTSFNVNTYTAGCTKVVLVEGSISVSSKQGNERMISTGELAVVRLMTPDIQIGKVDIEPYIAWNSGRFVFDNCSLENLMETIGHWYDREVQFKSEDIRLMYFTGDVDRYGSVGPIMRAIQRVTGLDVEIDEKKIILRKK